MPGVPIEEQLDRYTDLLIEGLSREAARSGRVGGCPFGNFAVEPTGPDGVIRQRATAILAEIQDRFAAAIQLARDAGELAPDVDPSDRAETLCAHMEGLMVLAKAHNDPAQLRRLKLDTRQLLGLPSTDEEL